MPTRSTCNASQSLFQRAFVATLLVVVAHSAHAASPPSTQPTTRPQTAPTTRPFPVSPDADVNKQLLQLSNLMEIRNSIETQLAELKVKLGPEHPSIKSMTLRLKKYNQLIQQTSERIRQIIEKKSSIEPPPLEPSGPTPDGRGYVYPLTS